MKEIGIVNGLNGKKAKVIIQRSAACGDCGACQVGKNKLTMEAYAVNDAGAQKGDHVEVEMEFVNVLKASLILYGIPLIVFIIGVILGNYIPWSGDEGNPMISFMMGLVLMAISFTVIRIFDNKGIFSLKFEPHITHIIDPKNF
ncbi:MAG: SoxR reducing system RseC family protein [Eubacteriales bacterium]